MKIKQIIIGISLVTLAISCTNNQGGKDNDRKTNFAEMLDIPTTISFEKQNFDFGTVKDGDLVTEIFKFTNSGDQDLILLSVKGSCGCTVPENWPKEPIAPGQSGEITVTFNSAGRVGNVRKNVRIEANTIPSVNVLNITGKVVEI